MRYDEIIARVRGIVDRHALPDFMRGYDVRLGEFDGNPALWVVFRVTPGPSRVDAEVERRVAAMRALYNVLRPDLLEAFEDRFPYFRTETIVPEQAAATGE